jgi:6-pyruvoyl-tetrahydropterin synthase
MAASIAKPLTKPTKQITPKQQLILKTKQEHPDLTTREIGAIANVDHSYVVQVLARYGISQSHVEDFKANRANVFAGIQHRLLNSITDEDIQKAPMGSRILAVAQLFDKERLERDLSSINLASVSSDLLAMQRANLKEDDNSSD